MNSDKRQATLGKIAKLLAKAESTDFGPERDALLEKVDKYRTEYAVNEWELTQAGNLEKAIPVKEEGIPVSSSSNDLDSEFASLFTVCCKFFDVVPVYYGLGQRLRGTTATVVGFPEDIKSAQSLYQSLRLQMATHLEPHADLDLRIEENVQLFKQAGFTWAQIWNAFHLAGVEGAEEKEPNRSRLIGWQKRYKVWAEENGLDVVKTNPKTYKRSYVGGFNIAINDRVNSIVRARNNDQGSGGTSTSLVLASRSKQVQDKYEEEWADVKLSNRKNALGKIDAAGRRQGQSAGKKADLGGKRVPGSRKALS